MSESVTMIERVARAAYFAGEGLDPESAFSPDNDAHWQHWWKEDRTLHEAVARAAIEAMAEGPTEAMTEHETYTSGQWNRRNYEAIFSAALSSEKEGKGTSASEGARISITGNQWSGEDKGKGG
jgi:hypothetical protein